MSALTIISPLAFPLTLKSGQVIETVGDAANYLRRLPKKTEDGIIGKLLFECLTTH